MPTRIGHREIRQVVVDVEEGRAGNMAGEIELTPPRRIPQLPAAVHELNAHEAYAW
jgi:hypothetical protein